MAIFLDRDGTINYKRPEDDYVKSWSEFEFLPGALEGLRELAKLDGVRLICVTNQRGIARGRMTEAALAEIHARMLEEIQRAGGRIDAIYHCPHEAGECNCRKPLTGLFEKAQADFPDIEFAKSLVVGDALSDMKAAAQLGCSSALVGPREATEAVREMATRQGIPIGFCVESLAELVDSLPAEKSWRDGIGFNV